MQQSVRLQRYSNPRATRAVSIFAVHERCEKTERWEHTRLPRVSKYIRTYVRTYIRNVSHWRLRAKKRGASEPSGAEPATWRASSSCASSRGANHRDATVARRTSCWNEVVAGCVSRYPTLASTDTISRDYPPWYLIPARSPSEDWRLFSQRVRTPSTPTHRRALPDRKYTFNHCTSSLDFARDAIARTPPGLHLWPREGWLHCAM